MDPESPPASAAQKQIAKPRKMRQGGRVMGEEIGIIVGSPRSSERTTHTN